MSIANTASELHGFSLSQLKDKFSGRRCYIIGNGPSLNNTDLSRLKDEITIGLNRIYIKFPDIGFSTTFLCCVNELVLKQFGRDIANQPCISLVNDAGLVVGEGGRNIHRLRSLPGAGFATDLSDYAWHPGATVTYCALQLAFHLGITEVVLLGVDHNFQASGRAHQAAKSQGADVNHFDPNYFGKNVVWQYPDLPESEINYATAREVYRIHGRTILDATVGGKLRVFQRIGGYALDGEDNHQCQGLPPPSASSFHEPPSERARFYQIALNSRFRPALRYAAIAMMVLSALCIALLGVAYPPLLAMLLAGLALVGGGALFAVTTLTEWTAEWSRRRRLREGRTLVNVLEMIGDNGSASKATADASAPPEGG